MGHRRAKRLRLIGGWREPLLRNLEVLTLAVGVFLTWSAVILPTLKYCELLPAKYRPETEAEGASPTR